MDFKRSKETKECPITGDGKQGDLIHNQMTLN